MICNNCHSVVADETKFCPNCGAKIGAEAAMAPQTYPAVPQTPVQPGYPYQAQIPAARPFQPLMGMICGIVSVVLAFIIYFVVIVDSARSGISGFAVMLLVLDFGLAVFSLTFSIIGMRKSIRTGGRKYVAGIVFSAVGISCAAAALLFLFLSVLIGSVISEARHYRYY